MEQIKAIETHYNGFKFRSRLEARWAVFFDAAGIRYEYEPEGFEHNGVCYLPDFYLPDSKTYVEVKPDRENAIEELQKPFSLIIAGKIQRLIILPNIPEDAEIAIWWFTFAYYHPGKDCMTIARASFIPAENNVFLSTNLYIGYVDEKLFFGVTGFLERMVNTFLLTPINDLAMPYDDSEPRRKNITNYHNFPYCDTLDENELDLIRKCYTKARQARFEHGQKG